MQPDTQNRDPLINLVANVVPVLNGRDSSGNIIYLGPQTTKIHRYLIVVFLAKATQMFRLMGKEIDNSVYFTLYGLGKVAESFKQFGPHHIAIQYDRTKVAGRIYKMISNNGLVTIKIMGGETYITITDKGEDVSTKLLQELIAYGEVVSSRSVSNWSTTKRVSEVDEDSDALLKVEKKLAERIVEMNSQIASKTRRLDDRRHKGGGNGPESTSD